MRYLTIAIIIVIIYWLNWAIQWEKYDFKIRTLGTEDIKSDYSLDKSLEQIETLSKRQLQFPKWRRCLIMSIIMGVSLSILLFNSLKTREMLIILLCTFTLMYACYNFYDFHYYEDIQEKIYFICENIRRKNKL